MVIFAAISLAGCANSVKETQPIDTTPQTEAKDGFLIPEVGVHISLPDEYTLTKSSEKNRRGSFVSYEINSSEQFPSFNEVQVFSEESIKQFTSNCGVDNDPCFFGDYPDLESYNGQKSAFDKEENYKEYELKKFGDRNYFVSNSQCNGDSCVIREYTTFINDDKIDVWIAMDDETQTNEADALFEKFEIIE